MKDIRILEPTAEEHAYHLGWECFHHDRQLGCNPYNADDEIKLYECWIDGWSSALLVFCVA